MEKGEEIEERVTMDAVHRRFLQENDTKDKNYKDGYYFCQECKENIRASSTKEELRDHFNTIKHNPSGVCVHCSGPVYNYIYKKKLEVYHMCKSNSYFPVEKTSI